MFIFEFFPSFGSCPKEVQWLSEHYKFSTVNEVNTWKMLKHMVWNKNWRVPNFIMYTLNEICWQNPWEILYNKIHTEYANLLTNASFNTHNFIHLILFPRYILCDFMKEWPCVILILFQKWNVSICVTVILLNLLEIN